MGMLFIEPKHSVCLFFVESVYQKFCRFLKTFGHLSIKPIINMNDSVDRPL